MEGATSPGRRGTVPGMSRHPTAAATRTLLMTADPDLLDELLRLASAAGVELEVAHDLLAARRGYTSRRWCCSAPTRCRSGCGPGCPDAQAVVIVCRPTPTAPRRGTAPTTSGPSTWRCCPRPRSGWSSGSAAPQGERREAGRVLAVLGGRGGAGASVLAAGLCVTASRSGLRTLLVDADPLGGGADLLLGWEEEHGLRWPQLAEAGGRLDAQALVAALPSRGDLVVLSCDRAEPGKDRPAEARPRPAAGRGDAAALDAGRARA